MEKPANVLFAVKYPSNTGYAWDYFERLFARVADSLATRGIRTFVSYPEIQAPPGTLEGSAAEGVELDASLDSRYSRRAVRQFVREHDVGLVYYTDRPTWRWAYGHLRLSGVRHIVVADHTSGARTGPRGAKKLAKWAVARLPWINADQVVTPSEYVRDRQVHVVMNPPERVTRIYYGFSVDGGARADGPTTHATFGLEDSRPIVACACRAAPEKGVHHLLRAFDRAMQTGIGQKGERPALVYLGDGPMLEQLGKLRSELEHAEDIVLGGFRPEAVTLLKDAAFFVVPSVWQDALPLAVMEPMSRGKPVVGSRVGGIPEMIEDGESGLLVDPGDEEALAEALTGLLEDPSLVRRMGRAAKERVAQKFSPEREFEQMMQVIAKGLPDFS